MNSLQTETHREYLCPNCFQDVAVGHAQYKLFCPKCGTPLKVCRDAEFVRGSWNDLTTLRVYAGESVK